MFATEPRPVYDRPEPLDRRARQLIDALSGGFISVDADCRIIDCNAGAEQLFGRRREDLLGVCSHELSGLGPDTEFSALLRRVAADDAAEEAELRLSINGRTCLLAVRAFPLADGVGVLWQDITATRAAERRLAESEAQYCEIAHGMPTAAWLSQADGRMVFLNQAMVEALGRPREALLGEGWLDCVDPQDRAGLAAARDQARAEHSSVHYETRFRRPDGSLRIIELYGRPRFDAAGAFCGHVGVANDVTEARAFEERQRLLLHELNHRVKNTLATVQSLVRLTLRDHGVPRATEEAVTARLLALSTAHNVLNRENWEGADLDELVGDLLRPYDRVAAIGPAGVRVKPKTAIALAMALQELATNALKYGALSSREGRVELSWARRGAEVELDWCERGGPPVAEPAPELSGFGSFLLGRMLASELGQPAELVYAPAGLVCHIRAPLAD